MPRLVMAGQRGGNFRELISPFLREKLKDAEQEFGRASSEYQAIARQYVKTPIEDLVYPGARRRHYEAELNCDGHHNDLKGVERLYRRTVLLMPTTACVAHCRWCLRGQYEAAALRTHEIDRALAYFAADAEIREILVTGGDPFTATQALAYILNAVEERVPNIEIIRIGTRVPLQDPERISGALLQTLQQKRRYRLEVGIHVCHPVEFWPESVASIQRLLDAGIRVYNQHPLLKGVNDSTEVLAQLYDRMRQIGIEAHYLFHAIPMQGMAHHRTSIQKGLDLMFKLSSGGYFSGRSKPHYCAMTDIGKVVLYEGCIVNRDTGDNKVLLRSGYRAQDRLRYNSSWVYPDSVELDGEGSMLVWYPDGDDDLESVEPVALAEKEDA